MPYFSQACVAAKYYISLMCHGKFNIFASVFPLEHQLVAYYLIGKTGHACDCNKLSLQ